MRASALIAGVTIAGLCVGVWCVWYGVLNENAATLRVSFLDIGQGDSILIRSPSGHTVLIDGGPDASVLRELSKQLPWYQKSLDVVIATHPDSDHIAGLIDVLERYRVSYVLQSSVLGNTPTWSTLQKTIQEDELKGTVLVTAQRGEVINLGGNAYLEVLSPDRSVPNVETNMGCVVTRLVYGNTSFMLPCDAPQAIEKYLVDLDGRTLHSAVLKAGHHGSKTSSSPLFVGFVDPQYVVYSRGCHNKYGFPHATTVATLKRFNIPTLDTCEEGTVTFESDGQTVRVVTEK